MTISQANSALIVIDIQGKLARTVDQANDLLPNWLKTIQVARLFNLPIIVLEQYPEGLGNTIPELQAELGDSPVIAKRTFSGYQEAIFREQLAELHVENILIMGVEAHVCVFQTAQDLLLKTDFNIYMLADAVSSRKASDRQTALRRLEKAGAILTTTEMSVFELMHDSADPKFKDFLKIIK